MLSALFAAYLFTQAPAAKVATPQIRPSSRIVPADPPPVSVAAPKAEPLPEVVRLKVENLQLQADILGRQLKASEAYLAYEKSMAELGKAMDVILAAETKACFTVDQIAKTRTPIAGCKAGK